MSNLESPWWFPNARPFRLGPFSQEPYHIAAWAPPASLFWSPELTVDVGVYSLILLLCDLVLTLAWYYASKYVVTRKRFRLKFLSPSVRFTFGVIFGASRLWAISHLQPTMLYFVLSRLCFVVYLLLGLSALVFDDGPLRNIRPNERSVMNRNSFLNPYGTLNKAIASSVSVTKLTLARPAVRRSLEQGKTVTIVLDKNGSLLYARRGQLDVRDAVFMRNKDSRCIIELVARKEQCKSGTRDFFGYLPGGGPFEYFGRKTMTLRQKQTLLELLLSLNDCKNLVASSSSLVAYDQENKARANVRWFQVPKQLGYALREHEAETENDIDGDIGEKANAPRSLLDFYKS